MSDRSGSPQLYVQALDGGRNARRVTFEGNYNVSPTFSPDGRQIAYVRREGGRFKVMLLDLASGCVIHKEQRGNLQPSDHAPVMVNLAWPPEDGDDDDAAEHL